MPENTHEDMRDRIKERVSLKDQTTLRVGGEARYFVAVHSVEELAEAFAWAQARDMSTLVLGGGSNLLVADRGFRGLVIKMEILGRAYTAYRDGSVLAIAAAGENWDSFVQETVENGLFGLENLSLIPGTVGATPIQNVGAYGVEVKDLIEFVETIDTRTGESKTFGNSDCAFAYRDSFFKTTEGRHYAVVGVGFRLARQGELRMHYKDVAQYFAEHAELIPTLASVREAVILIRGRKFPDIRETGTAGSFFKNPIISEQHYEELSYAFSEKYGAIPNYPVDYGGEARVKVPLAWFLERFGWKGVVRGNVGTFERQPIVLVTNNGASADELLHFARDIIRDMKEKTDIDVEMEVTVVE